MLSFHEANLPAGTPNVDQALQVFFPERTIESIKGQKNKNPGYLDRHRILLAEAGVVAEPGYESPDETAENGNSDDREKL